MFALVKAFLVGTLIFFLGSALIAAEMPAGVSDASAATADSGALVAAPSSAMAAQASSDGGDSGPGVALPDNSVSYSGAFQWSYQLRLPAGTGGATPAFTLSYNSAVPNGLLGMGFLLTGLSTIEKDPNRVAPSYTTINYVMDGQRLYFDSDSSEKRFHPEQESFDKIQAFLISDPNTPVANPDDPNAFWVVRKKDGTKLYYGKTFSTDTSAATIPIAGTTTVRAWALSKVQDANGNFYTIQYLYDSATGAYYPLRVVYTQGNTLAVTKTVQFSYEARTDHAPMYQVSLVDLDHRLKWISVLAGTDSAGIGGSLVRKYRLNYAYAPTTGRSTLTDITEFGNDNGAGGAGTWPAAGYIGTYTPTGSSLPPTRFSWQVSGTGTFGPISPATTDSNANYTAVFADVNGDGKADWIRYAGDSSRVCVLLSNGSGPFQTFVATTDSNNGDTYSSYFADINGDGKIDWVKCNSASTKTRVLLSSGDGSFLTAVASSHGITGYLSTFVDESGDGRADWVKYKADGTTTLTLTSNGNGMFSGGGSRSDANGSDTFTSYFADVTGDGLVDWIKVSSGSLKVRVLPGFGGFFSTASPDTIDNVANYGSYFADVNGDGRADWVKSANAMTGVRVLFSKGDGTFLTSAVATTDIAGAYTKTAFLDINGDGRADWLKYSSDGVNVGVLLSNPNGTFQTRVSVGDPSTARTATFADVTGDGKVDMIKYTSGLGTDTLNYWPSMGLLPDLLTTITLGSGGVLNATYKPAPQIAAPSTPLMPLLTGYPGITNPSPRPLVTKVTMNPGLPGEPLISTSYQYTNGRFTGGFRGFRTDLGFEKVTKIDDNTGAKSVTTFSQGSVSLGTVTHGLPLDTQVLDSAGNRFAQTVNTYDYVYQGAPNTSLQSVAFIYQTSQTNKRFDGQATSTDTKKTFDSYDSQGNLSQATDLGIVNGSGVDTTTADNTRSVYTYAASNTAYLYRMTKEQIYSYNDTGVEGLAKETRYYYDGNNSSLGLISTGLVTKVESVTSGSSTASTLLEYDGGVAQWGNVTKTTDPNGIVTSQVTYDDTYHNLPVTTTDAAGLVTTVTTWDHLQPTEVQDPNGNLSKVVYDVFGRKVKTVSPAAMDSSGTLRDTTASPTSQIIYNDTPSLPATPSSIQTNEKTSGIGTTTILPSYTWFDGLGRPVQTKTQNKVGGQYVTVDTYYDASGRKVAVSSPYLSASASFSYAPARLTDPTQKKTSLTFDAVNRVTRTTNPDGTYSRTIYNQTLTTNVDELNHVTQTEDTINVQKKRSYTGTYGSEVLYTTVTVTNTRGKTVIEDDKDNNPATAGNKITTLYDLVGRKTNYTDPDMGAWSYTYNANGSLDTQTDTAGTVISFEYDSVGRALKKWEGTIAVPQTTLAAQYTFGDLSSGYQKGRLTGVTAGNLTALYTYDQLGRSTVISKTIGVYGTKIETLTYNADGRPQSVQLDSGETVSYSYTPEGQLNNVAGTSTYLASILLDDFGRTTSQSFGNTTSTSYTFDPVTFRTTDIVTTGVMNLHYTFDAVGNVLTKTESTNTAANETFTYDDLYRLKTATGIYGSRTYLYDAIGNLLGQNNIANNTYTDPRPHAINGDGTSTYGYNLNGNMISRTIASVVDRSYSYDVENRLTQAIVGGTQTDYTYDDTRQRTTLTTGGKTTVFWFGDYEETYTTGTQTSLETTRSYLAGGAKIAQRSSVSGLVFLYQDHLGSTSKVRDSVGTVTARYYEPYGKLAASDDGTVRQLYTGQEWDASADLYYYNARFYSATLGRFIQPDSVLDGLNRYAYCHDNPINGTDPSGHALVVDDAFWLVAGTLYTVAAYLKGATTSGNWNPLTWNLDTWKTAITLGGVFQPGISVDTDGNKVNGNVTVNGNTVATVTLATTPEPPTVSQTSQLQTNSIGGRGSSALSLSTHDYGGILPAGIDDGYATYNDIDLSGNDIKKGLNGFSKGDFDFENILGTYWPSDDGTLASVENYYGPGTISEGTLYTREERQTIDQFYRINRFGQEIRIVRDSGVDGNGTEYVYERGGDIWDTVYRKTGVTKSQFVPF